MKFNIIIRIFVMLHLCQEISLSRSQSIALCTIANGELERKGPVRNGTIRKGDSIFNGDKITVEKNESIAFLTIYEKCLVSVYENSVIKVEDNKSDKSIFPGMALFGGKVVVKMEENNDSDFILNAPTATITANGAHFIAEYRDELFFDNNTYSILTVLGGKMKVENNTSGKIIYVNEGDTIIATRDGKLLELDTFKNSSRIVNHLSVNQ